MSYLLDTNIVSLMIQSNPGNPKITQKIESIKSQRISIFISCITYFEIRRGFLAVDAPRKRERFNQICQIYPIILLDDLEILEQAAKIHANLRLRGLPIQTEDVLIAATAMIKNLILVSNDSDLSRVEGLNLESWLELSNS